MHWTNFRPKFWRDLWLFLLPVSSQDLQGIHNVLLFTNLGNLIFYEIY